MGSREDTVLWRFAGERDLLVQEDGVAGVLRDLWDKQQAVNSSLWRMSAGGLVLGMHNRAMHRALAAKHVELQESLRQYAGRVDQQLQMLGKDVGELSVRQEAAEERFGSSLRTIHALVERHGTLLEQMRHKHLRTCKALELALAVLSLGWSRLDVLALPLRLAFWVRPPSSPRVRAALTFLYRLSLWFLLFELHRSLLHRMGFGISPPDTLPDLLLPLADCREWCFRKASALGKRIRTLVPFKGWK